MNKGKKLYEGLYNTGKKVGDWTEFYKNGRIKQIEVYDGSVNRSILKKLSYHSNGKVYVEKIYKFYQNNLGKEEKTEHGKWVYYNENGDVSKEVIYENGKIINTKEF